MWLASGMPLISTGGCVLRKCCFASLIVQRRTRSQSIPTAVLHAVMANKAVGMCR